MKEGIGTEQWLTASHSNDDSVELRDGYRYRTVKSALNRKLHKYRLYFPSLDAALSPRCFLLFRMVAIAKERPSHDLTRVQSYVRLQAAVITTSYL